MTNLEPNALSERELDILRLVATGASNKEIAQQLFISSNTVKVHLRNIFSKIGATSRTEAAMYAVRIGLVPTAATQPAGDEDRDSSAPSNVLLMPLETTPDLPRSRKAGLPGLSRFWTGAVIVFILASFILAGLYLARGADLLSTRTNAATPTEPERWRMLAPLPVARRNLAVASFENQLYAIGGESEQGITGQMECFDPENNTWVQLPAKPTPVTDIKAAVIGGLIYVPGGQTLAGIPTSVVEVYDPRQQRWLEAPPLPLPLSGYALVAFEGQLFLFGGWDGSRVRNTVFTFDPDQQKWQEQSPMPTARTFAGAAVIGSKIYILGGTDGQRALSVNEIYQPDIEGSGESPWSSGVPLPAGRYQMGVVNIAEIIHLIGGNGPDQELSVIAYTPGQEEWGQIEASVHQNWFSMGVGTVGSRLFALGGETDEGLTDQVWSYQAIFMIVLPIVR